MIRNNNFKRVFVAGRLKKYAKSGRVWDLIGVFSTEKKAVAECRTGRDFVLTICLNEPVPEKRRTMRDAHYPIVERPPISHNSLDNFTLWR